jgi:hypothetical protein
VPRAHRLVAYCKDSVEEAGTGYALPWRNAAEISEIIGMLTDARDQWLSDAQAATILRLLGAKDDPSSWDWCLHLRDTG